jgi:hypothetical protein
LEKRKENIGAAVEYKREAIMMQGYLIYSHELYRDKNGTKI